MAEFDWQAGLNHPLTILGAGMMMGGDASREGAYGLGYGLMNAGNVMREQSALAAEQERARALADLQMQTYRAKLAQQQSQQDATEAFAAANPEYANMIRAGYGAQAASALTAQPPVSSAMRLYRDAGGQQGTGKAFSEWLTTDYPKTRGSAVTIQQGPQMGAIPQSMARVEDPSSPTGTRLVTEPGAPEKKLSEPEKQYGAIAEENVRLIEEVQDEMTDEQGNVIPEKLAESRIPGTPLYGKIQTISQNETYMKSGAAATASETAVTAGGIRPSLYDIGSEFLGSPGTALEKLQRSKAFAQGRAGKKDEPTGWKVIKVED